MEREAEAEEEGFCRRREGGRSFQWWVMGPDWWEEGRGGGVGVGRGWDWVVVVVVVVCGVG